MSWIERNTNESWDSHPASHHSFSLDTGSAFDCGWRWQRILDLRFSIRPPSSHYDWMLPFLISFWCFLSYLSEPSWEKGSDVSLLLSGRAGHPRAAGRSTARWGTETLGTPRWIRLPALSPTDKGISVYSAKNDKYSRSKLRSTEPLSLLGCLCGICTRRHLM